MFNKEIAQVPMSCLKINSVVWFLNLVRCFKDLNDTVSPLYFGSLIGDVDINISCIIFWKIESARHRAISVKWFMEWSRELYFFKLTFRRCAREINYLLKHFWVLKFWEMCSDIYTSGKYTSGMHYSRWFTSRWYTLCVKKVVIWTF